MRTAQELEDAERVNEMLAGILHRTANALHGGPLDNGLWSFHDLPKRAEALIAERNELKEKLASAHALAMKLLNLEGKQTARRNSLPASQVKD